MIGIDEVGRGAWAGPLLVVAVRQKHNMILPDVTDSKLLTKKQRNILYVELVNCVDIGEGWVWPEELNQLCNLTTSLKLACKRALLSLSAGAQEDIIIDGNYNFAPLIYSQVCTIVKADLVVPLVSAASIIAKVKRDQYMSDLATKYPKYSFDSHVGYGTHAHRVALLTHGVTKEHRLFYKPVALAQEKYEIL